MYQTLRVRRQESMCFVQLHRPAANNTINAQLVSEFDDVLAECERSANVVVLEGLPQCFSLGADFGGIATQTSQGQQANGDPARLYDLWLRLAHGPFVTIAHVRGKANAGGIGFVAAADIVIADATATFSLSELLFGVYPACVMPFLIRRIGWQRANYLALMTQPIGVERAREWGLVDACDVQSEALLRKHLLRVRRLAKDSIGRYKNYARRLDDMLSGSRALAVEHNREMFADPQTLANIARFVESGMLPWEES